jgi:Tfp pilus assembly protein PilV
MNNALAIRPHRSEAGFTLMEALIALLIMAFGMLAIAGFQTSLSRNSEVAKQRAEAVRLAQQKIEDLRSFSQLSSSATGVVDYANDVVSGSDTITGGSTYNTTTYSSNTAFTRTWTVTKDGTNSYASDGSDLQKWINVSVAWTDRTGTNQSVTLNSVISRSDPQKINFLASNSGSTTNRQPKNRSIDIPYPATNFDNGTSGFKPGGSSSTYFIFDNTTGNVLYRCSGSTLASYSSSNCTAYSSGAYLLGGYIYYYGGSGAPLSASDLTLEISASSTFFRNSTSTSLLTGLSSVGVVFYYPASASGTASAECFTNAQGIDSTSNSSTQYKIIDYTSSGNYYYVFTAYVCVVTPVVMSTLGTTARWYGQFVITGSSWSLGSTNTTWHMCRFTGDYDTDNVISNSEHPQYYRGVTGTLDNQNYVVIPGNNNCPNDTEGSLSASFRNNNTILHQDTAYSSGSRPFGGALSTGSQWSTTPEPSDESTPLSMGSSN